jgi:hypothetical protein
MLNSAGTNARRTRRPASAWRVSVARG